ncbi:MAG: CubicO group peptidase (beta-lactamase class C family) [Yoonia sp.]
MERAGLGTVGSGLLMGTWPTPLVAKEKAPGLPRGNAAAEDVDPQGILDFVSAIEGSKHELHSLMILRHGRVITEGWWAPYRPEFNHGMYSMSKSFTSTAVGLAVDEGRLSTSDKVISFFPESVPAGADERIKDLTVKHLLTMSVGQKPGSTAPVVKEQDWVKSFLALPLPNGPGTVFSYNSVATYMLSAIVQKLTGETVLEYLTPRLFEPLGIIGSSSNPYWEQCPNGINTGGWGLHIRTEGLAHLGQLYLQNGVWEGKQILSKKWISEATSKQIQQLRNPKSNPDWVQGYGYQFWRCRHGGYRGDGAFGQFTIVLPKQDAVIVMTGESPSMQDELDLVWKHLLPSFKDDAVKNRHQASKTLNARMKSLAVALPKGKTDSPIAKQLNLSRYQIAENPLGIQAIGFRLKQGTVTIDVIDAQGAHKIPAGTKEWKFGAAAIPGTPPRIISGGKPPVGTTAPIVAAAAWKDDRTLVMHWRYYETPHHDTVTCVFEKDHVEVSFLNSIQKRRGRKNDSRAKLKGTRI